VNDGTSCVQATISLVVQNDDDDCHRQSITVQSVYANNTPTSTPLYMVLNTNASNNSGLVNWGASAPQLGICLQPQVLPSAAEEMSLAVLTGLVVKRT
jgi:hypothetical protein